MNIFILAISLLILSFSLTPFIMHLALHYKILDIPNERSSHEVPTPRGGGLAIVIAWYVGISVMFFLKDIDKQLYFTLLSGLLLAGVSIIDDLIDLKPVIRFSIQVFTAGLALCFLKGIKPISISGFEISSPLLLYPLVIIGIVWFINLFNFLDGIDGYASLEAIFISFAMFLFTGNFICIIIIAPVMGFLNWNWPKARIFMGDIGSTQLGFILIVLGLFFHNEAKLPIVLWIMLSSLFWFDATITLFRRWSNKEKLTQAHRKHAYQRIVQSGFSHRKTILFSLLINSIILALVYIAKVNEDLLIVAFLVNMIMLYSIVKLIDKRIPFGKV
jgi:UDP-N-acetylmuramyl pentapeptide phosphotransferase/UDP-N-acetylglucosamine-1-phosphate transferase